MMFKTLRLAAALSALALLGNAPAAAADLAVHSGGAVKTVLSEATDRYAKAQHISIDIRFMPMGPLMKRLNTGLATDVVVLTKERMDEAVLKNIVDASTVVKLGAVAMGVAVNENAKTPDISTAEKFKAVLLAAKSIVYIDPKTGTSGAHFAKVLDSMGIAEAVKAKTTLGTGGFVVAPVGKGEIELGIHQISEILPVPGVKLVGTLPLPYGLETVYQGAVTTQAKSKVTGKALLEFLQSAEIRKLFKDKGFVD